MNKFQLSPSLDSDDFESSLPASFADLDDYLPVPDELSFYQREFERELDERS